MSITFDKQTVTGLVLCGGRGSRMGGVDKGLQLLDGMPLVEHAIQRLQPQVGKLLLNANRHLDVYQRLGLPVLTDNTASHTASLLEPFVGPLAGFSVGLQHCETPFLMTVPCDTPYFPTDLVACLSAAMRRENAEIAMAVGVSAGTSTQKNTTNSPVHHHLFSPQPTFSLLRRELLFSLQIFMANGGRKISAWAMQHKLTHVAFTLGHDRQDAFFNANTLTDLRQLENSLGR